MRFVYWLMQPSSHVLPVSRALAKLGHEVHVIAAEPLSGPHLQLAGSELDFSGVDYSLASDESERARMARRLSPGAHNYFSGIFKYPPVAEAQRLVATLGPASIMNFSEPWNPAWPGAPLRRMRFAWRARRASSRTDLVLVAGQLARRQFSPLFSPDRVRQFGYFVDPLPGGEAMSARGDRLRLIFVGQLVRRKAVDLLLRALADAPWKFELEVVGAGPERGALQALARERDISVVFRGALRGETLSNAIRRADLLILPSIFDGWGAVVNEALSCGTPCIVSSRVGAQDLLVQPQLGQVFDSGDVRDLRAKLWARAESGPTLEPSRRWIRNWADQFISPLAAACHLAGLAEGSDGVAPWHSPQALVRPS